MEDYQVGKFRSDYDPDTVLYITRSPDGDITFDIQGGGECRLAMSGGMLQGERKVKIVKAFQVIIDNLIVGEKNAEFAARIKKSIDMDKIREIMGNRLKAFRKAKGLAQQNLADKMGLSRFTITLYETGTNAMPIENLYEIADILDITVFDLLPKKEEV